MLGEHKNVVHFLRTERSTDTNNYWHPKNNIRVLNHWNQWPKENELTSSIASSVMTQKMFLRHTANNFNNQHPQKKTLTHFIHEQLFICPLWFLLFLNECWNILTNFFLLGAIIFIWSWGWLKMQSLWYIISYYQVVNLQSPSITWMQCMGLHWLWRQLPQGAHLEFLKLDPLTPLSICTKNLFFFFSEKKISINILSCRHLNALESDEEK